MIPGAIDSHVHFRPPATTTRKTGRQVLAALRAGRRLPHFSKCPTRSRRRHGRGRAAEADDRQSAGLRRLRHLRAPRREQHRRARGADGRRVSSFKRSGATRSATSAPSDGAMLEGFEIPRAPRLPLHRARRERVDHGAPPGAARGRRHRSAGATSPRAPKCAQWRPSARSSSPSGPAPAYDYRCELEGRALPIRDAKRRGVDVTVETCPQYLLLSTEDMAVQGGVMRVNPPIREPGHQEPLWQALREGVVDMIATDQVPPHARGEDPEEHLAVRLRSLRRRDSDAAHADRGQPRAHHHRGVRPLDELQPGAKAGALSTQGRDPAGRGRRSCHRGPGGREDPDQGLLFQEQDLALAWTAGEGSPGAHDGARQGRDVRRQARRRRRLGQPVRQSMPPPRPRNLDKTTAAITAPDAVERAYGAGPVPRQKRA